MKIIFIVLISVLSLLTFIYIGFAIGVSKTREDMKSELEYQYELGRNHALKECLDLNK